MKKLMTSTIIILPLLLLAIMLVSGAIASFFTHIYVESIEFVQSEAIYMVMKDTATPPTFDLGAQITILPIKATNRKLNYSSEDTEVATVSADGIITAKYYGETYITVTSDENKTATKKRKVVVTDSSVHEIVMNEFTSEMYEGESQQLSVKFYPAEADNKAVKWESSNPDALQVAANGTATAVGGGEVEVTATSIDNPQAKQTIKITCHAKLQNVVFDRNLFVTAKDEAQFPDITPEPANCECTIEYTSKNEGIATVDQDGKISFKQAGKVVVSAKITDWKGTYIEVDKEFVSTNGYFVGPLFATKYISFDKCSADAALPVEFTSTPDDDAYRAINSIECTVDDSPATGDLVAYDPTTETFKFVDGLPQCERYIDVVVNATVYDFKSGTTVDQEDWFRIARSAQTLEGVRVTYKDQDFDARTEDQLNANEITFDCLDDQRTLCLAGAEELDIRLDETAYVGVAISQDKQTITLTSKAVCTDKKMYLSIGTKTYVLSITITNDKVASLGIYCDNRQLQDGGTYQTLLDSLDFVVKTNRSDGQQVLADEVLYQTNGEGEWTKADIVDGKITIATQGISSIAFKSNDKQVSFNISKQPLQNFGIKVSVVEANGNKLVLNDIKSQQLQEMENLDIKVSSNIQDSVTIELVLESEYLGGVGDDTAFAQIFAIDCPVEGWQVDHNAQTKQVVITFVSGNRQSFDNTLTIKYADRQLPTRLKRVQLKAIEFDGFDSQTQTHFGYQQTRVFAKHSYYDKQVDYFKVPYKAQSDVAANTLADPEDVSWRLTRFVGNRAESVVAQQEGYDVTYNGQQYKIVQSGEEYVLKRADDLDGEAVSGVDGQNEQDIIWIDVFTEPGIARIYFGDFKGLSESDVYNDYFGNFDDKPTWTTPAQAIDTKNGGLEVVPSQNAYTFLRVEAGDGALVGGVNCHFNFQVLEDDSLVNVFNATGYYNNSKIVLHTNLYGEGELESSEDDASSTLDEESARQQDLLLTRTTEGTNGDGSLLGKDTVYGNGFSINFQVKNELIKQALPNEKNNGLGAVVVKNMYNLVVQGCNMQDRVDVLRQKIILTFSKAFYCDIMSIGKGRPISTNPTYIKNTVMRYASFTAFQLYGAKSNSTDESAYLENVEIIECNLGLSTEMESGAQYKGHYYLKGNVEIFSYTNVVGVFDKLGLDEKYKPYAPALFGFAEVSQYFEFFGNELNQPKDFDESKSRFANLAVYIGMPYDSSDAIYYWDDTTQGYTKQITTSANNPLSQIDFGMAALAVPDLRKLAIISYSNPTADGIFMNGATARRRWPEKLFTSEKNIRLLCQYKNQIGSEDPETNEEHLLWHIQQVYRDLSQFPDRTSDHIEDLKNSLIGKDIVWHDDTTPEQAVEAEAAMATTQYVVLPSKRRYAA